MIIFLGIFHFKFPENDLWWNYATQPDSQLSINNCLAYNLTHIVTTIYLFHLFCIEFLAYNYYIKLPFVSFTTLQSSPQFSPIEFNEEQMY